MPRPMGPYNAATIYGILDIVNHKDRPWICKKDNTQNIEPSVLNIENWQMLFDVDIANADTLDGFDSSYFVSREKASSVATVVFGASAWLGETAPYVQTVVIPNIKETDTPTPQFVDDGEDEASSKAKKKAYGFISYFDSGDGSILATCKYKKPEVDFSVAFKGV